MGSARAQLKLAHHLHWAFMIDRVISPAMSVIKLMDHDIESLYVFFKEAEGVGISGAELRYEQEHH
jgi:hypothetical protein